MQLQVKDLSDEKGIIKIRITKNIDTKLKKRMVYTYFSLNLLTCTKGYIADRISIFVLLGNVQLL